MKVPANIKLVVKESLRDWFKKEKWVRISSSGNIAGDCGTSKNKKNPDRCLPKAKAQSLTKGQRAATAAKKKKAGSKGKTVVKNTKKATVQKEGKSAEELKSHIEALSKARAQAASKGQTTLLNSYHKEISKAQKELKKITTQQEAYKPGSIAPKDLYYSDKHGKLVAMDDVDSKYHDRIRDYLVYKKGDKIEMPTEGLWANINAKKKAGKKSSHKNSNAYKDAKKAGTSLEKTKEGVTKEDLRNLVVGMVHETTNENTIMEKDDRCTRLAKSKYDTWPSAYASGAVVRCRRGEIWKKK